MKIYSWAGSKIFLANQIAEFLKKIFLKKHKVNLPDILYPGRDSGKVNCDFKKIRMIGS